MSKNNPNYFTRQEEIPWFSQKKVSSLTIAVVGVGGIGCNLALMVSRLGFKKIHLIDYDVVEATNLNRQTLYSKNNIGMQKVTTAKKCLDETHNLTSEIVANNFDIFKDWQKTIKIVKESDYVLNGLDLPEIKRSLLGILCLKLSKPMIYCGTDPHSGYSGMILYQASAPNTPCYECLQAILCSIKDKKLIQKYAIKQIDKFTTIDWKLLEQKEFKKPNFGATTVVTAMCASTLAINLLIHAIHKMDPPQRVIFDLYATTVETFKLDRREDCLACSAQDF